MSINIIPCSIYNVPAMEAWLEKMSRKGLHFHKFTGAPWAEFYVGEPREWSYRLEPCRKKEKSPDSETIAAYHAAGWDYVSTRKDKTFHVWRSRGNAERREIHTDPVVQGYSYEWLEKKLRRDSVFNLLVIAAAVVTILWMLSGVKVSSVISNDRGLISQLFWVVSMYSFFIYQIFSDLRALRKLVKSLRAGVPMERGRWVFPGRRLAWYGYFGAFVLYLVLIWYQPGTVEAEWEGDPATYPDPLPYVSVEQLGREEQVEWAVYWETSYLAENLEIVEGDYVSYVVTEGPMASWRTGYYPGRTSVWRLRLKFMADDLLADMVEYQKNNMPLVEQLQDERFDEAWYAADEEKQLLLLRRGEYVMRYVARVPEDLREHLDLFAEAMEWEYRLPETVA